MYKFFAVAAFLGVWTFQTGESIVIESEAASAALASAYDSGVTPSDFSHVSRHFPYYSYYNYGFGSSIWENYALWNGLYKYSSRYNFPYSDLLQWYDLFHHYYPNMSPDDYLAIIEGICKNLYDERRRYMSYYSSDYIGLQLPTATLAKRDVTYEYEASPVSYNSISSYIPTDLPMIYQQMYGYLNYIVPNLSTTAITDLTNLLGNYPVLTNADEILFQIQHMSRFMLASQMYFSPVYY